MSAPYKNESPAVTGQFVNQNAEDTAIIAPAEKIGKPKRVATLCARAALAGVTLNVIENDHGQTVYIVSRWAMTRELADLDAVEVWLNRVTGVSA